MVIPQSQATTPLAVGLIAEGGGALVAGAISGVACWCVGKHCCRPQPSLVDEPLMSVNGNKRFGPPRSPASSMVLPGIGSFTSMQVAALFSARFCCVVWFHKMLDMLLLNKYEL